MFSVGPQYTKLKTNLRLSINRLKLLEKKKTEQAQKSRKEIADYIAAHKEDRARIRVEHIIREDYIVEAYELLEMYCDLLLARFGLIQQMKELDEGIEEAVNSILWAAPRIVTDVQEFKIISDQLTAKYGKPFAEACRVNQFGKVNPKLMHKLGVAAPPKILVEKYMIEIAKSCNVPFTPDENVMREDEVAAAEAMLIDFQNQGQQGGGWMYPQPPPPGGPTPPPNMQHQMPPPAYPHISPTQSMIAQANQQQPQQPPQAPQQQPFNYPAPKQHPEPEDISNMKVPPNESGGASAPDANLCDSVMPPGAGAAAPPPPNNSAPPAFELPTLPDPPKDDFPKPPDSPPAGNRGGGGGGGDDAIDYDDLTRRFENLKKHK